LIRVDLSGPQLPAEEGETQRRDFSGPGGAAAAWRIHRSELMAAFGNKPGRRPWAYWRFDIGLPAAPVSPLEEIAELNARGLLDRSEQMLIEKEYKILKPNQSVTYATCAHLHVSDVISLGRLMADYAVAALWHSQRNRPQLREKYERLGERVSERIGGVKRGSDEAF
jgi:hypothetical protein